jgi:hypothetical protein
LTAELSQRGKVSSEVITRTVGEYLSKLIERIAAFGGDVVKFLGDAILVTFSAEHPSESKDYVMRRAIRAVIHVFQEQSEVEFDLENYKSIGVGGMTQEIEYGGYTTTSPTIGQQHMTDITLGLHVAMVAGEVSQVILGDPKTRLDYCIYGKCMEDLHNALEFAKSGELSFPEYFWTEAQLEISDLPKQCRIHGQFVVLGQGSLAEMNNILECYMDALIDDSVACGPCPEDLRQLKRGDHPLVWKFVNQSIAKKQKKKG